ncbi:hypothetical protein [Neptunomonas marina]|uniref:Uncharacterized protein n=1 Tax=Neptunomonas marina TaxID=1815562 RepID=A0A437QDQ0_9GAMM|nr:hypothetical protein [Neptunomonas marina]RVU32678.1 hypothetical protein EOE65_03210 [Neptunomonas marina]
MDIKAIVDAQVSEMIKSGALQKSISDQVENTINLAVSEVFSRHGEFHKSLETVLKEIVRIDPNDFSIPEYNQQMLVGVREKLGNLFAGQAAEKFNAEIDALLAPAPKEISLHELVSNVCELWRDFESYEKDDWLDEVDIDFEENDGCLRGSYNLKMRAGSEDKVELYISGHTIRISHRFEYNPTAAFNAVDSYIFKLYAAGTVITDIDAFYIDRVDASLGTQEEW